MVENKSNSHKHLFIGVGVIAVAVIGLYGYYHYMEIHPSTDNAYVNANLVNVAPKVGGYIKHIYVKNNQPVHKGDLLVDIDPQDFSLALNNAKQNYLLAKQQSDTSKQQIATAKAALAKAKSDYDFTSQLANRYALLYKQNAGSLQDMQKYSNQQTQARQTYDQAQVTLEQANLQYAASKTQIDIAKDNVENAQNNKGYTQLSSPVDGYVTGMNLQNGELVAQGQKIFGLVDDTNWWLDANFKETQLKRIKPGQKADIELDMYDHRYKGEIQSISYASGNTFSLLPAQNATGNWVKVTQRFTVRIKVLDNKKFPLRVGASAKVTIDTSN